MYPPPNQRSCTLASLLSAFLQSSSSVSASCPSAHSTGRGRSKGEAGGIYSFPINSLIVNMISNYSQTIHAWKTYIMLQYIHSVIHRVIYGVNYLQLLQSNECLRNGFSWARSHFGHHGSSISHPWTRELAPFNPPWICELSLPSPPEHHPWAAAHHAGPDQTQRCYIPELP